MFPSSTKREIRHFHVVAVQRRQRNVQKSVMHVQSCCSANLNPLLFLPLSLVLSSPSSLLKLSIYLCRTGFFSSSVSSSCLRVILDLSALPSTSKMSPVSPHVRESKTVLDSGFNFVGSGFQVLLSTSFSVELRFRISIASGIPDSYSCIPDSNARDSGLQKQKFPRFRNPHAKISKIPDSTCKNFQDSGILMQKFPRFRIPHAKIPKNPDYTCKNFRDFGIRIPLYGGDWYLLRLDRFVVHFVYYSYTYGMVTCRE